MIDPRPHERLVGWFLAHMYLVHITYSLQWPLGLPFPHPIHSNNLKRTYRSSRNAQIPGRANTSGLISVIPLYLLKCAQTLSQLVGTRDSTR
ncbi:hypothetical protein F5890DRAFT_1541298 [Lentinula detonsa]|uniref:Uncharacterized protein n=1 Tax=Lentinula detonsa TaxID=2804962 RepID=A0AA38UQP3_9AGAR|nr:hypothetical protein F5890DRAFT_1541298 [Lentinula detonsa]